MESQSITREAQPLTAYQYFENVRNFLVAVEELKLPAFEACDLERVNYLPYNECVCNYLLIVSVYLILLFLLY